MKDLRSELVELLFYMPKDPSGGGRPIKNYSFKTF